jgi:hypothetical protein
MQPILRPVGTVLNFGIPNMFTMLGLLLFTQSEHDKFGTGTNFICAILGIKKYLWFRFQTDPIFSADPLIFSKRLTVRPYFLWVVAGCCQNGACCHTNY